MLAYPYDFSYTACRCLGTHPNAGVRSVAWQTTSPVSGSKTSRSTSPHPQHYIINICVLIYRLLDQLYRLVHYLLSAFVFHHQHHITTQHQHQTAIRHGSLPDGFASRSYRSQLAEPTHPLPGDGEHPGLVVSEAAEEAVWEYHVPTRR
jgi:hypothetical protein